MEPLVYLQRRIRRVCETEPIVGMYHLVGAVEIVSRFLVAAPAARLARQTANERRAILPDRPSLWQWLDALRKLMKRLANDPGRANFCFPSLPQAARVLHELSISAAWDPP